MHEKSKEKNATGENVVSFNTLNSAAIKKQLVETWDKINNFITFPCYNNSNFLSLDI